MKAREQKKEQNNQSQMEVAQVQQLNEEQLAAVSGGGRRAVR